MKFKTCIIGSNFFSCDEHEDAWGSAVLREDAVVQIRKVQIVVNGKEESALAAYLSLVWRHWLLLSWIPLSPTFEKMQQEPW
jgi:hypothetical protein